MFPVQISLSSVRLNGERHIMALVADITKLKHGEERNRALLERLMRLRAIDRAILAAESPQKIASDALRLLRKWVGLPRVSVALVDDDDRSVTLLAHSSARHIRVRPWKRQWNEGFAGEMRVLKRGRAHYISAIGALRQFSFYDDMYRAGLRSQVAIPMVVRGRLLGVLLMWSEDEGRLSPEIVDVAWSVANQIAIAMQARAAMLAEEYARELERRVDERTRELQKANADLDAFAYSVSHDLRAPLRAMQGFGHAILEDYGGRFDDVATDAIQRIVSAAERMDALIRDILNYSRSSRRDMIRQRVSVVEAVDDALNLLQSDIESRSATVTKDLGDAVVLADPSALTAVLSNLVSNAIKFTPESRKPRVRIRAVRKNGSLRIWVIDNGIGIGAPYMERIFQVFERLHPDGDYQGTGIGLATVRRLVERMGGSVGVESREGKGSRFWVELPLIASNAYQNSRRSPDARRPRTTQSVATLEVR